MRLDRPAQHFPPGSAAPRHPVAPPDINRSESFFACDSEKGVIYYALAAVKGVGRQAMDHVVAQREAEGPFRSLADFARRVDAKLVNKRAFESLVRAGAFDALSPTAGNWWNPPMRS
jgi:DNA polymerase-3 subunit alpha